MEASFQDGDKSPESEELCALWHVRRGRVEYDIFETEEEAARHGVGIEHDGYTTVLGVQFADGRLIKRQDWQLYAHLEQVVQGERLVRPEQESPRPVRYIGDPFTGRILGVRAEEPGWIGKKETEP